MAPLNKVTRKSGFAPRAKFYYNIGVSLVTLPITFLGFSRSLYDLVDNLPILNIIFPTFSRFLLIGGVALIPGSVLLGWLYTKTTFYGAQFEIPAERTPYKYRLTPGKETVFQPFLVLSAEMTLKIWYALGVISPEVEEKWNRYIRFLKHLEQGGDLMELEEFKKCPP